MNSQISIIVIWLMASIIFFATGQNTKDDEDYVDMDGFTSSNESNCTNDYCISDKDYINLMFNHIYPDPYDWVLIAMHSLVFFVGLIGNLLVCIAVYRNYSMRTVTNYFIVNLAVGDLMVIIICLPSTVLWDVTETWFLGLHLCKIVPYFQTVSVSVSVLTLTFISIDRWYAICFPLRFKSTTGRAKTAIIIIWVLALLFDIPELLVLQTVPATYIRLETILFTQCAPSWSDGSETTFTIIKVILLYTGPLTFMTIAYWQIVRVLWRNNIPGHSLSTRTCNVNEIATTSVGNPEGQLRSRRKAAKMLVAVVLMFAICYFPVHLISVLRRVTVLPSSQLINNASLIAHWLVYANSAVNPVIYNFMSGKFRKEFKRTFCCPPNNNMHSRRGYHLAGTSNPPGPRSNTITRFILTTNNNNVHQSTEVIPLSAIINTQSQHLKNG